MLRSRWVFALAWLLLGAVGRAEPAPPPSAPPADFPFLIDVWRAGPGEQRLPQSSAISIIRTSDGYLWMGTLNGLVRFDGVRFTVFDIANTPALECNQVIRLFEDSRSNLWVGTETAGVVLIGHDGTIRNLGIGRGRRDQRLMSVCEDSAGAVWLNMADGQVVRCRDGRAEILRVRARAVVAEKNGPVWLGVDLEDPLSRPMGQRLVAITAVSNSSAFVVREELPVTGRLDYLLASSRGGYWRIADGRVQKWSGARLERDLGPCPWDPLRTPVKAACEDADGNLIVGTFGDGVYWYDDEGRPTRISTARGLSNDYILSLCRDSEDNLWVGTDGGGLNRVKRRLFDVVNSSRTWTIQSVSEDEAGGLWLGTFGSGLKYLIHGKMESPGSSQALTNLYIRSVFVDTEGRVLVGTAGFGLFKVVGDLLQRFPDSEMPNPFICAICQDSSRRLWFGTQGGLVCCDGERWRTYTVRDGLLSDSVRAVAEDSEGGIWVGMEGGGLERWSDGRFTVYSAARHPGAATITSLLADPDGTLWIGTDGLGLQRLSHGKWTTISKRSGLISDSIGYLIEDGRGYLWIGSYAGLMRVSLRALTDFANGVSDFVPCRAFGESDGLPSSECTQGSEPAACLTRQGTLWFPTIHGVVSVNPARLTISTNQAPVVIESVLLDGQEQNTNIFGARLQRLVVPPGKERLEVYYTSLNFSAPDNVRFRYRLAGHETAWTDADRTRVARFSNLAPGRYRFQVTACNEDGVWNETGTGLAIVVLPPFWRTSWFLGLNAAILIGLFVLIVHYFSTQKLQRQLLVLRQQEALEKERGRIARDLHDQLGANLTQVALLGEMAETDKHLPQEVQSHAQQITQTARETTRALDEIVWAVNPLNDTVEGLITYACKYAQEYFALAGLRYRLDVPARLPDATLAPEVRHNVFLAFKEAVNNIVKHAQATEARIGLQLGSGRFVIEIQDNGRGCAAAEARPGRNGLRNMRRRMEDVGGSFDIRPGPDGGTHVRLTALMKDN